MISVIDTALELEAFCKQQGWQYCFIGGIALQRWGEMRFTADVDLTLLTGFTNESMYMDALITHFMPRIPDIKEFALQTRVLLLKAANGVGIDIALGALPFEERTIERATLFEIATKKYITTCCAEDLVVHKAFANRDQDWLDIRGILKRNRQKLNQTQILEELRPLVELKEEPEIIQHLERMFAST